MTGNDPQVLSVARDASQVTLELRVPPQLQCFAGHFPGQPILPGVMQLAWAAAFGEQHLQAGTSLVRMESVKFSRVIQPDAHLSLVLSWSPAESCLSFRYTEREAVCSSGRFIFRA